jgi:hypothetical protein
MGGQRPVPETGQAFLIDSSKGTVVLVFTANAFSCLIYLLFDG